MNDPSSLMEIVRRAEQDLAGADGERCHYLLQVLAAAAALGTTNIELRRQLDESRRIADARTAEALHNEALFRTAFENAGTGISHVAPEGHWLRVNQKLCDILGYSREALLRLTFQDLTYRPDLEADLGLVGKVLAGEIPSYAMEKRYVRSDGSLVWANLTVTLVRRPDGTPDYFISIVEDITERKLAEQQTRQHAMFFEQSQEGVVILDPQGCVVDANASFERITEYHLDEIRGKHISFLQPDKQDGSFFQDMWQHASQTGPWQGEVWNRRKSGEVYLEWVSVSAVRDERGIPVVYVGTHIDINRMNHVQSEIERLAHHDALTGLPNRLLLMTRLEHALQRVTRGGSGAVLFIDLDRFKQVNDTLGHPAGDELLIAVAQRLQGRLRSIDTLARLGGDEFVIVLEDIESEENVVAVAQEIIGQMTSPFDLSGATVRVGASVGIALFPSHGKEAAQLIALADQALYMAKTAGKGTYRVFSGLATPTRGADA